MRHRKIIGLVLLLTLYGLTGGAWATTQNGAANNNVIIANEYIAVIVNAGVENTGRFSINTTGGDPDRIGDENKPLVYGMADPWTSYTTIQVDGENFVFGGRTQTSAGRKGPFGKVSREPEVVEENIVRTVCKIGPVEVEQTLSFTRSTTTGLKDTARVAYTLTNIDNQPHQIGMRLMLDTMLGSNDGAPYRVKDQSVTTDTYFKKDDMPDFWQAFDSLGDPQVMSQGTLLGVGVTPPDRVYFSNWGVLAERIWDFDFQPGRIFLRKGEFELDSAIAMFWDPIRIEPGESVTWVTHYGLGGITIAPGKLSLGVTSPAVVAPSKDEPTRFPVIAYLENTGEGDARDVRAAIQLPKGLSLVEGQESVARVGNLPVGESVQLVWQLEVDVGAKDELSYTVRVEAANSEPNQVRRQIRIVSPARLTTEVVGPPHLMVENGRLQPVPFAVRATIQNVGEMDAPWVQAEWQAPLGLELAPGESRIKLAGDISPGTAKTVQWFLMPTNIASDNLPYSVKVQSGATEPQVNNGFISIPQLPQMVSLAVEDKSPRVIVDEPHKVIVRGLNLRNIRETELILRYPVGLLRVVGGRLGVEPGRVFGPYIESTGNQIPMQVDVDPELGLIWIRISHPEETIVERLTGSLCALRMIGIKAGQGRIYLDSARFTTSSGQVVELGASELSISVIQQ
ncbi:MAG: cellulosome anchor protein [Firmicutes bacterium]|nr:cellulosome anchor protein [Bacillota bacterium]